MVHQRHSSHGGSQVQQDAEPEFVDPVVRRARVLFTKQMRERQSYMQDLKQYRRGLEKKAMRTMRRLIGPRWYQVLSVPQREALDNLEQAIYQDLLEGRPPRTAAIMKRLGIDPHPSPIDLMNCNFHGSDDPKKMLAELFFLRYGHSIDGKRNRYPLNARLLLSSILYLGLKNLIELLRETFKPDEDLPPTPPKPKLKPKPRVASPYLEKTIIPLWYPAPPKKFTPRPLPNLDVLNEPYTGDLENRVQMKVPPPPPPVQKKRVSRALCDDLAGVIHIAPHSQITTMSRKTTTGHRKRRETRLTIEVKKKTYGICITAPKSKGAARKKLKVPPTGSDNIQVLIQGVFKIAGRTVCIIGNVVVTPAMGELVHGGFASCDGGYMNIHFGYRAHTGPPPPDPCDCLKKWQESVFRYVKGSKCYCGHNYDYGNEGTFPPDELPYFQKPVAGAPYQFNYHTIFDIDEKQLLVKKEIKKVWDTDSVIGSKKGTVKKKEKTKRTSKTCLGKKPKPQDYLKCALRLMRNVNVAARLPDIHLTPELLEWMRRRIHGPFNQAQRQEYLRQTNVLQTMLDSFLHQGYGHVISKKNPEFQGSSNWFHKFAFREKFIKHSNEFKRHLFKSFADVNNLFWRIMFPPEFPDKKFREIFFSYLCATADDLMLMHPYSTMETVERKEQILKRRMICLPDGIEPDN